MKYKKYKMLIDSLSELMRLEMVSYRGTDIMKIVNRFCVLYNLVEDIACTEDYSTKSQLLYMSLKECGYNEDTIEQFRLIVEKEQIGNLAQRFDTFRHAQTKVK